MRGGAGAREALRMVRHSFSLNSRSLSCIAFAAVAMDTPSNGFAVMSLFNKAHANTVNAARSQMSFATAADLSSVTRVPFQVSASSFVKRRDVPVLEALLKHQKHRPPAIYS